VGALAAAFRPAFSYLNSLPIALLYPPPGAAAALNAILNTRILMAWFMHSLGTQLQQNRPLWWLLLAGGKGDDYHMSRSAEHP
jgi:hypothetical protein